MSENKYTRFINFRNILTIDQVLIDETNLQNLLTLSSRNKYLPIVGLVNGKLVDQGCLRITSICPIKIILADLLDWKITPCDNDDGGVGVGKENSFNFHYEENDKNSLVGLFFIQSEFIEYELDPKLFIPNPQDLKILIRIERGLNSIMDQNIDPYFNVNVIRIKDEASIPCQIVEYKYNLVDYQQCLSLNLIDKDHLVGNIERISRENQWSRLMLFNNELVRIREHQIYLRELLRKRMEFLEGLCELKRKLKDPDYIAGSKKKVAFNQVHTSQLNSYKFIELVV